MAADRAEDLYNDFDRNAPGVRRDHDLIDELSESAAELSPRHFVVRSTFAQAIHPAVAERIRNSIASYFGYRVAQEYHQLRRMPGMSSVFPAAGIGIFARPVFNRRLGPDPRLVADVVALGSAFPLGWRCRGHARCC